MFYNTYITYITYETYRTYPALYYISSTDYLTVTDTLYNYPSTDLCSWSLISPHNAKKNGHLTRRLDSRL